MTYHSRTWKIKYIANACVNLTVHTPYDIIFPTKERSIFKEFLQVKEQEMGLPEGWELTTIDKIGKVITGKTPSTKDKNNFDGKIPFVKPNDLDVNGFIYTTTQTLSEQGVKSIPTLPKNSIMVTCIGNLGKVGITTKEITATNQQINSIIPFEGIDYKYIYFQLLTLKNWLESESSATTISIINKSKFSKAPILLPSYEEQQHLSQKLTALLDGVSAAKQRLEKIPALLKQFRQSVLADAVSGKLTEEWRGTNEYDENGYPIDWNKQKLSDLGELSRGKSKHRPRNDPQLFGSQYPFIQTGDVANSNGEICESKQFYSEFGLAQSKLFPKETLCITIAANIADTSILKINACFPDSVVGFISNKDNQVLFVKYLIDVNKNNLERFAPATAQKNINLKILNELTFSVPPKAEQTQIIQKVETYFALANKIETEAANALEKVNLLTQSILAKAFRGELSADWRAENKM